MGRFSSNIAKYLKPDNYFQYLNDKIGEFLYLDPYRKKNQYKDNLRKKDTITIFASPRGGSTWMANILMTLPGTALIYEPLFRNAYPELSELNFDWNQHIPQSDNWPEAHEFFRKLLNRQIVNVKIYRRNRFRDVPKSNLFIYKIVRGNLLLPWLVDRFDVMPILLIRHPCSVVASQLNHPGWRWVDKFSKYYIPQGRGNAVWKPYVSIFKHIREKEEVLAAEWAMLNKYVIDHPYNNKRWITVSYEGMLINPEKELKRVFGRIGRPVPDNISGVVKHPVNTKDSLSGEFIRKGDQLEAWRHRLTGKQIERVLNTVSKFNIKFYGPEPEPDYSLIYPGEPF